MTPQEALAQALMFIPEPVIVRRGMGTGTADAGIVWGEPEEGSFTNEQRAAAILAALPEGWRLHGPDRCVDVEEHETTTAMDYGTGLSDGAQQERERLRALVDAAKTLATFMRAPDYDSAGKPADWTPGLDAIGDFYAAVDALGPQP